MVSWIHVYSKWFQGEQNECSCLYIYLWVMEELPHTLIPSHVVIIIGKNTELSDFSSVLYIYAKQNKSINNLCLVWDLWQAFGYTLLTSSTRVCYSTLKVSWWYAVLYHGHICCQRNCWLSCSSWEWWDIPSPCTDCCRMNSLAVWILHSFRWLILLEKPIRPTSYVMLNNQNECIEREKAVCIDPHIWAQHSTVSAAGIQNSKLGGAASFCLPLLSCWLHPEEKSMCLQPATACHRQDKVTEYLGNSAICVHSNYSGVSYV